MRWFTYCGAYCTGAVGFIEGGVIGIKIDMIGSYGWT